MITFPEIVITPDCPTVKFRNSREQVDLDVELPKILNSQGWDCGTYFHIQFVDHNRENLLASATFVVTKHAESLQVNESNPYQPITKTVANRKAEIVGEWWTSHENLNGVEVKIAPTISWNPGKKLHQLKLGAEVIYENANKDEVKKVAEAA